MNNWRWSRGNKDCPGTVWRLTCRYCFMCCRVFKHTLTYWWTNGLSDLWNTTWLIPWSPSEMSFLCFLSGLLIICCRQVGTVSFERNHPYIVARIFSETKRVRDADLFRIREKFRNHLNLLPFLKVSLGFLSSTCSSASTFVDPNPGYADIMQHSFSSMQITCSVIICLQLCLCLVCGSVPTWMLTTLRKETMSISSAAFGQTRALTSSPGFTM